MAKEYKNPLTLDGKIKLDPRVSEAKVKAVKELAEATMSGDRRAKGILEESITTSDAIFNYAALVNANVLPEFEELPPTWSTIAGVRLVSDFRSPTLYSINPEYQPGVVGSGVPRGVLPVIPEASAYPYATLEQETSEVGGIRKHGLKAGFTMEAWLNDSVGALQAIPDSFRRLARDTDEAEVYTALVQGVTADSELAGGTVPTGATVPANAPLSRDALIRAQIEMGERQVNGRFVRITGGFNLIVPRGQGVYANFILNQTLGEIRQTDGGNQFVYGINGGYNPLGNITVVESEYIVATGDDVPWYLVPQQGGTAGRPVLELLRLTGHELPELRVNNATGVYVGGGAISPFEGNFENDAADFRIRTFARGILWSPELVIFSDGSGS